MLLFRACQGGFKFGQESPERFKITLLQAAEEFDQVMVGRLTSRLVSLFNEKAFRADFFSPCGLASPSTLNRAVREQEVWSLLEVKAG